MNILEIDSVNLSFDERSILSHVYLKCETGNIVGINGRNGSGKSCLMKIIFGSMKAQNQSVRLNGQYARQLFTTPNSVNYLPQDGFTMNYLTFNELVKIFDLTQNLDRILAIDEIRNNTSDKIGNLSGGAKKLMEIVSLLYANSQFTILDEPFSYLSPVLVEKIVPHITYQSKSKGIIISDHQYETVFSTCNKFYVLYEGILQEISQKSELADYGYILPSSIY